jgi:hypothetical protein
VTLWVIIGGLLHVEYVEERFGWLKKIVLYLFVVASAIDMDMVEKYTRQIWLYKFKVMFMSLSIVFQYSFKSRVPTTTMYLPAKTIHFNIKKKN